MLSALARGGGGSPDRFLNGAGFQTDEWHGPSVLARWTLVTATTAADPVWKSAFVFRPEVGPRGQHPSLDHITASR